MAAAKKGGLGKGIDSLIPNKVSATKTEVKNATVSTASSAEEGKDGTLMGNSLVFW